MLFMLPPCPNSPNCVSTMSSPGDKRHYMEPIHYSGSPETAKSTIRHIIRQQKYAEIVHEDDNYISTVFTTPVLKFKDDVVFYFGDHGHVHFRSASRIGKGDMGKNKNRMKEITAQFYDQYN